MHIAKLRVRRHRATSSTHGNEGAITALVFVRTETLEAFSRGALPFFVSTLDVTGRLHVVTGESRARVQRTVGSDRVRMAAMNLAGTHMHAVERVEARLARLLAQKRHLLVHEVARVAGPG